MSFRPSPADRPPPGRPALRLPRWPRYLVPVVAGLIALGILVTIIAGVWTDWLWYRSVGYSSVFDVTYGTRWALLRGRDLHGGGDRRQRRARLHRADLRYHRVQRLAHLAAVHQPGPVRPQRPAVQAGHLVLRVHLPVPAADPQLPVRGGLPGAAGRRGGACALRRAGLAGQAAEGHDGRAGAALR